ncbi:hypothetical protein C1Y63_06115 [Corynebacterium sp. 13CS0277]|uniref:hypothetical protein n=1 Tax=Corynebacterium sp. 13CS0277 TaxID=2071994 RepID=UPI000D03DDA3|nr:hypothetical protein [Corynebacterium sp. 13CS0277]PRQ11422.1 hypothetical protein C1Y63_06115 [Corynebacterium sp. 13CS0277]
MATGPMRKTVKATDEMRERAKQLNDDNRVRVVFRVPPELRKTIKRVALEEDITVNDLMLQAIELRLAQSEAGSRTTKKDN